jgi:hypothetical protein
MISKILLPKSLVKKIALLLLTLQLVFVKKIDHSIVLFFRNTPFFSRKLAKTQKIVIVTSVPDLAIFRLLGGC